MMTSDGASDRGSDGGSDDASDGAGHPVEPLALAEPARQRLVQVAAEVLGRMPAEEVPSALRPIARFAPAKRARLGAAALSAALDADDDFRARVADAVTEATPQLVRAVREHQATPASDPADVAVVAYLIRPDGWTELVRALGTRWADEQRAREASAEEATRLRAELADLRAQVRAAAAAQDERIAAAVAAAGEEAARLTTTLRNTLRTRTAELRSAVARAEAVEAQLAAADAQRASLQAEHDTRLKNLDELRRAGGPDGAERNVPDGRATRRERELDDARLRLLLDTLTDAAAGVRRELALPAGTLRPADVLATGLADAVVTPAGARDAAELDRLLELPHVHLIVDGYNVTKTGYPELPLADQRQRLIGSLAAVRARTSAEITIAFDGAARPPAQPRTPRGVRVLFSAPDELADDLIRRLVAAEPPGRAVVVATTDRAVATDVARDGARTVPSAVLLQRLG